MFWHPFKYTKRLSPWHIKNIFRFHYMLINHCSKTSRNITNTDPLFLAWSPYYNQILQCIQFQTLSFKEILIYKHKQHIATFVLYKSMMPILSTLLAKHFKRSWTFSITQHLLKRITNSNQNDFNKITRLSVKLLGYPGPNLASSNTYCTNFSNKRNDFFFNDSSVRTLQSYDYLFKGNAIEVYHMLSSKSSCDFETTYYI